jgi:hypothetical protein
MDHVVSWYEKPDGFDSWNHVEYTNHPSYAVATAQKNVTGTPDRVFLINLQDSSYLPLAEGHGLRDPYLWFDPMQLSETPDPYADFAKYDLPIQCGGQDILTKKLKLMWKYRDSLECLIFGSSPAHIGINPSFMPSLRCLSMATRGSDLRTSVTVAMEYAFSQVPYLKVVGVALDPGTLDRDWETMPPRLTGLYDSKGHEFDSANDFWREGLPDGIVAKIRAFGPPSWSGFDSLGFTTRRYEGGWGQVFIDEGDFGFGDSLVQEALGMLAALADTAAGRGVHVLAVNFPQHPGFAETEMMGRLGPSWATFAQIDAWLRALEERNAFFHYYDAHMGGRHDYTDADAFDCNHLSYTGAAKLSARIDSVIQTFVQ